MLISNKLHSFRNFQSQTYMKICDFYARPIRKKLFSEKISTDALRIIK